MSPNPREVVIRQATIADLDSVVPLFDDYRQFYRHPTDLPRARQFLYNLFANHQSVIFLAFVDSTAAGFTQLYPSFSSGAMARILILNDLFVSPDVRRCGAASALLAAAAIYGQRVGAVRLVLSTELTNTPAQRLYESAGWKRDTVFCTYELTLPVLPHREQ